MPNISGDVAAMKLQRANDAAEGWSDHLAKQKATAAKTVRLRQERLAREAELTDEAPKKD